MGGRSTVTESPHGLWRTRRLLRALLLFVLLATVADVGILAWAATGAEESATLLPPATTPPPLSVPVPREGDQVAFRVPGPGSAGVVVAGRWLADESFPDAAGILRRVHSFEQAPDAGAPAANRTIRYYAAQTHEWVAEREEASLALQGTSSRQDGLRVTLFMDEETMARPDAGCLLLPRVGGTTLTFGVPVIPLDPCRLGGLEILPEEPFVPIAVGRLETRTVFALESQLRPGVEAWFADGLPYPIRLRMTDPAGGNHVLDVALTAFTPGTASLADGPRTPADFGVELTEPLAWGMDEAGVASEDLPYRPSEFYRAAFEAADYDGLRVYHADHPGARLANVDFYLINSTIELAGQHHLDIVYEDAGAFRCFEITLDHDGSAAVPAWSGAPGAATYSYLDGACPEYEEASVAPPETVPTLASFLRLWRTYGGQGALTNIHLGISCPSVGECEGAASNHFVGHEAAVSSSAAERLLADGPPRQTLDFLVLEPDGTTWMHHVETTNRAFGTALTPADAAAQAAEPRPPASAAPLGNVRAFDAAAAVGGASVMAALVGFLYWAYPYARAAAAILLYTRLGRSRVLEHPDRARLVDLVRTEPGLELTAAVRRLQLAPSTGAYHLQVLAHFGHVRILRLGNRAALVPADRRAAGEAERLSLARRPAFARLLSALARDPGMDQPTLARLLGVTQQGVSKALSRLERAGLVRVLPDARPRRYELGPAPGDPRATHNQAP